MKHLNGIVLLDSLTENQCRSALAETQCDLDMTVVIAGRRVSLQFVGEVPDQADIRALLMALPALNQTVAELPLCQQRFAETGHRYELAWMEMESLDELALFYAGLTVNAQWGVEFERSGDGSWTFCGYC